MICKLINYKIDRLYVSYTINNDLEQLFISCTDIKSYQIGQTNVPLTIFC